jgi:hypothetical protein
MYFVPFGEESTLLYGARNVPFLPSNIKVDFIFVLFESK